MPLGHVAVNAGVDVWGFKPRTLEEIEEITRAPASCRVWNTADRAAMANFE